MKEKKMTGKKEEKNVQPATISIVFQDNALLPMLYGDNDLHLERLEKKLNVCASSRGNVVSVSGDKKDVEMAQTVLNKLYEEIESGGEVGVSEVDAAVRMSAVDAFDDEDAKQDEKFLFEPTDLVTIKTMKKTIKPYSPRQAKYMQTLQQSDVVFSLGPAGTGKTYIAVAMAVAMFDAGKVERIILSRPAVEAGEKLGFLPGDLKEKLDPYLRPLYDAMYDMMPGEKLNRLIEDGVIEIAPLAFMRGRTFSNAYVILDEAQNTTPTQMKMFLTRMGEGSSMVITGDLSQTDLPKDVKSGLGDAMRKLEHIEDIGVIRFADKDVVRHAMAARIIQAYDEWDRKKKQILQPQE